MGWTVHEKGGVKALKDLQMNDVLTDYSLQEIVTILMQETSDSELLANMESIKSKRPIACEQTESRPGF